MTKKKNFATHEEDVKFTAEGKNTGKDDTPFNVQTGTESAKEWVNRSFAKNTEYMLAMS